MSATQATMAIGGSASPGFETPRDRVEKALRACGADSTAMGCDGWHLRNSHTAKTLCNAVLEDEWLALSKPVTRAGIPSPGLAAPLQLLWRNAGLSGGLRYALVGDRNRVQLRTDIPWKALLEHGPGPLAACIGQALLGFAGAPSCSPSSSPGCTRDAAQKIGPQATDNDAASDFDAQLAMLCEEAGWPTSRKGSGDRRIEVALRDGYGVVTITRAGSGTLFRADLGCPDVPADDSDSGRAIGLLLLRVAGGVRMCRPVLRNHEDRRVLQLEAVFSEPPMVTGEIDCALGALSVAAEECLREVELLIANPHLARAYLDAWKMRRSKALVARKREPS
jgi:hypothetical protein